VATTRALRIGLVLFVVACGGLAETPPAASAASAPRDRSGVKFRFTTGDRAVGIPLETRNNHVWMRGAVGNQDSLWFLLDSGADGNCIREARAIQMGLELDDPHPSHGAGGSVESRFTQRLDVRLPGLTMSEARLATLPLEELGASAGRPLDVIIGFPLLRRSVVTIDYERNLMDVMAGEKWEYSGPGVVLPLTFENNLPYVTARVTLPGGKPIEGRFLIDTGNIGSLIFSPTFVEEHRALESVTQTIQAVGRGVGGQSTNPVGRVERFELGGIEIEQPLAMFRSPGPGAISAPGTAGNIGGRMLRRFKVIFDYPRSRMILEPGPKLSEPMESDMSGLSLRTPPPDYAHVTVSRVTEESPAAALGLRTGDELVSLDGRAALDLGLDEIREMFRRDGREYRLGILRDGQRLDVTLKTRRMI
jgi:hypothetical protein